MIVLVAKYQVLEGHVGEVLEFLREMKPLVAALEPGCALYQASQSIDDSNLVLLYEHYTSEDALQAHRETEHFARIIEGSVVPLLAARGRELFELRVS